MGPRHIKKIILATANGHKVTEFRGLISPSEGPSIVSLAEAGFAPALPPEDAETYESNADLKARFVGEHLRMWVMADDSGFEVEALGGIPGVYSARFMGLTDSKRQCDEILKRMQGVSERRAKFVCVLSLYNPDSKQLVRFRGECQGTLVSSLRGVGGFGYDPIFRPDGYDQTFSEMSLETKNQISHRAKAAHAFRAWWYAL